MTALVDESGQCWTREGFPHSPLQRLPSLSLSIQQIRIEILLFSICFILHFTWFLSMDYEDKEDIQGRNKVLPSWSPYHRALLHLNEMQASQASDAE